MMLSPVLINIRNSGILALLQESSKFISSRRIVLVVEASNNQKWLERLVL